MARSCGTRRKCVTVCQERPDPKGRGFVRTAPAQIYPDGARPTQTLSRWVDQAIFFKRQRN